MRLEVPFYKQTTDLNCGPTALKMIFSYFGENYDIEIIEDKVRVKKGKGVSTIKLAIAVADLGYKVELFSKLLYFNKEHLKKSFYQKYGDINLVEESKKLVEEAISKNVKLYEKTISLEELLSKISSKSIPISLIDWNVIKKRREKGYQGHFVVIVGYDEKSVYIHNQGFEDPTAFLKVSKSLFDKARKSDGTDEDILFIHRK